MLKNVLGDSLELDCVRWARLNFTFHYLSHCFCKMPEYKATSKSGPAASRWDPLSLQRYRDGKTCQFKKSTKIIFSSSSVFNTLINLFTNFIYYALKRPDKTTLRKAAPWCRCIKAKKARVSLAIPAFSERPSQLASFTSLANIVTILTILTICHRFDHLS